jgi:hypothetical protein
MNFYVLKQLNPIHGLANCFFKISFNIIHMFTSRFQSKPFPRIFLTPPCTFIDFFVSYMILLVYFHPHVGFPSLGSAQVFSIHVITLRTETKFHTYIK